MDPIVILAKVIKKDYWIGVSYGKPVVIYIYIYISFHGSILMIYRSFYTSYQLIW
jgi:hypothetical protein